MSWTLLAQLMILILWLAIMVDMVATGLQRRGAAATMALYRLSQGEVGRDGE